MNNGMYFQYYINMADQTEKETKNGNIFAALK